MAPAADNTGGHPVSATESARSPSVRADVLRNRARLLAAAHEAFAERGADASFEDIARRAGLGSATLYRHFPTRYALMEAVYQGQIDELCSVGLGLMHTNPPLDALERWLQSLLEVASARGLAAALAQSEREETKGFFDRCHAAIDETGEALLTRAQDAGDVRVDLDVADVLALTNSVALLASQAGSVSDRHRRLLRIVLDGIRAMPSPHSTGLPS